MSKQPEHNSERSQSQEPRCFARQHMTIEEFGLYTHARELSYKSKKFYLNARRCAKRFATTGKNTVYRLVASLEAKGWFQLLKEGRGVATQYLVLNHDEWAAVHPGECPETGQSMRCPRIGTVPHSRKNSNRSARNAVLTFSRRRKNSAPTAGRS